MPVAVGFHPYFQLTDAPRDAWTIAVAARTRWLLSPAKVPTGETEPIERLFPIPPQSARADTTSTTCFPISCATRTAAPPFRDRSTHSASTSRSAPTTGRWCTRRRAPRRGSSVWNRWPASPTPSTWRTAVSTGELQTVAPGGTWERTIPNTTNRVLTINRSGCSEPQRQRLSRPFGEHAMKYPTSSRPPRFIHASPGRRSDDHRRQDRLPRSPRRPSSTAPTPPPAAPSCTTACRLYYEVYGAASRCCWCTATAAASPTSRAQIAHFRTALQGDRDGQPRSGQVRPTAPDAITYEKMTDDLAALLDHLKVGPVERAGLERRRHRGAAARHPPSGEGQEDRRDGRQPQSERRRRLLRRSLALVKSMLDAIPRPSETRRRAGAS